PRARSAGSSSLTHVSTPGPWRPTELSMPALAGWRRGAGLPAHGNGASDFVVTAPSRDGSHTRATSSPCPNVPDAATIGFGSSTGPMRTRMSTSRAFMRRSSSWCNDRRRMNDRGTSDLETELAVAVVLLQRADGRLLRRRLRDPGRGGERGGDRRDVRDAVDG